MEQIQAGGPLLTNKNISLKLRGRLCSGSVQSSMLDGNKNWPVQKENKVTFHGAEMRKVR